MGSTLLFGRYRLVEPAGRGGTAAVWRSVDQRTGDEVAVKRLHPVVFASRSGRDRLLREFRALRDLRHPNVVRVRDLELTETDGALILDYVPGPSLRTRLTDGPQFAPGQAVAIARDVGAALTASHGRGIVHRDVSPGNVLLDPDGRARLTDFGIARGTEETTVMTADGSIIGTLRYLAPEQLRGEDATPASDLYALAAVTYEMLAGRPAFAATTPVGLVEAQRAGAEPIAGIAPALDSAVRRALSTDPAARQGSVTEFVSELQAAGESRTVAGTALPAAALAPAADAAHRGHRRSVPLPAVVAAGFGALVLGAVALGGLPDGSPAGAAEATRPPPTASPAPTTEPPAEEARDTPGNGGDKNNGGDKGKGSDDDEDEDKGKGNGGGGGGDDD
jgi:eukaryotic-like serine/threonine-protein kinase